MWPELFSIPAFGPLREPIGIHAYGIAIAIGFIVSTFVAIRRAKNFGLAEPERFADLAFYLLLIGLLGSRALFIAVNWQDYVAHPEELIAFWRGGLVFYGGFILALAFSYFWTRRQKLSFLEVSDAMMPALAIGHAFGRLGCFAAGCCFGRPTNVAWAVRFPEDSVVAMGQHAAGLIPLGTAPHPVHPTQLYEAAAELLIFAVLMWVPRKFRGQQILTYLILYPIARSIIEIYRGDSDRGFVFGTWLSTGQFVSLFVALAAGGLVVYLAIKHREAAPSAKNVTETVTE